MKKFELKWKLYNYISIRKVGPQTVPVQFNPEAMTLTGGQEY